MPKLTPCPREDCTADVRHWHNHAGATFACTNTKRKWCRKQHTDVAHPCHLPHVPASSQVKTADNPIVLPTVKEVRTAIIMAEHDGGWIEHTVARAVLDLIASRVPVWQPVEPGTIRPGMRVRYVATGGIEGIFTVEDVADGRFYFKSGYAWSGMSDHAWFVDPRTVPAEPEDPRVAVVREWLSVVPLDSDAGDEGLARDLLASIDAARAEQ